MSAPPALVGLDVAGSPEAWRAAGFAVRDDGGIDIGQVRMQTGTGERGISAWSFSGLPAAPGSDDDRNVDGLVTRTGRANRIEPAEHPNGATLVDHVVLFSPDGERTTRALESLELEARRQRETAQYGTPVVQTFFRAGEVIIELVGPAEPDPSQGSARFFGIACTVRDLDACAALLGDALGSITDAVQPGRRIATVRHRDLGLSVAVAFMSE